MTTVGEKFLTPRDTADVCEIVRESFAVRGGRQLRIVGGGSWLDAGRPVLDAIPLRLTNLAGVVEYIPGDLTLTAHAATPLAELQRLVRAHGQWVPLDAMGNEHATVGGALATAGYGPLSATVGRPRDVALGVELVTGEGRVIRGGGRVVKNVAGFDMVRLNVGAWGTLGIITEATVRLRALPTVEATIAVALASEIERLTNQLLALRSALLAPLAMEMLNAVLASRLDIATADIVLVRVAGNEESVRAQRQVLESLGDTCDVPHDVWDRLQRSDPEGSASMRLSHRPSELATLWGATKTACASIVDVQVHANIERGIVRVVVPGGMSAELQPLVSALASAGHVIAERLPVQCWGSLGADFASPLAVGARRAFDPGAILNRGVLAPHA